MGHSVPRAGRRESVGAGNRHAPFPQYRMREMDIGGIVIAGGAGRRLGGPKAVAELGSRTLVQIAVAALAVHCQRVVVVTRPGIALPEVPAEVLLDRPGPDAPITGLATGLAAARTPSVLVLACDLPLAGPVLARLLAAPGDGPAMAVDPQGHRQPLCARYPAMVTLGVAEGLLAAGAPRMMRLADALDPVAVPATAEELLNVNTPDDLARAAALRGDRTWAVPNPPGPGAG